MTEIGDRIWFAGDEVEVISAPYILHGAEFQDARTDAGRVVTFKTARQKEADAAAKQREWKESQAAFARLRG